MNPNPTREPTTAAALILVVDDEPQIRKFLDISLRAQGYRVQTADNGRPVSPLRPRRIRIS